MPIRLFNTAYFCESVFTTCTIEQNEKSCQPHSFVSPISKLPLSLNEVVGRRQGGRHLCCPNCNPIQPNVVARQVRYPERSRYHGRKQRSLPRGRPNNHPLEEVAKACRKHLPSSELPGYKDVRLESPLEMHEPRRLCAVRSSLRVGRLLLRSAQISSRLTFRVGSSF